MRVAHAPQPVAGAPILVIGAGNGFLAAGATPLQGC